MVFASASAIVVLCGTRLARLADAFADASGLGEAVTGTVLLGALTSLAGAAASIAAASSGHADLAMSNAFGGIAVQTVFLVAADFAWARANLEHAAASLSNIVAGVLLMVLITMVLIAGSLPSIAVWHLHPVSLLLPLVFWFGVHLVSEARKTPLWRPDQTEQTVEDVPDDENLKSMSSGAMLRQILALGAIVAVAGWLIAESGMALANNYGVRHGLLGLLGTSVITSLPELVTTIAAVRRGALTLAVGGILGGNAFDVLFATFSDAAYTKGSIYHAVAPDQRFLLLLTLLMTAVLLMGLLRREPHGPASVGVETVLLGSIYAAGVGVIVFVF